MALFKADEVQLLLDSKNYVHVYVLDMECVTNSMGVSLMKF